MECIYPKTKELIVMAKMSLRKTFIILMIPIVFSLLFPIFSLAEEEVDVSHVKPIEGHDPVTKIQNRAIEGTLATERLSESRAYDHDEDLDMSKIDGSQYIPDTTITDANKWVNRKGKDVINLFVTIAEPVSILTFIFGLFMTLAGAIAKTSHMVKGFIVMAISIIVYVGAVFAPELVHFFSSWLVS